MLNELEIKSVLSSNVVKICINGLLRTQFLNEWHRV